MNKYTETESIVSFKNNHTDTNNSDFMELWEKNGLLKNNETDAQHHQPNNEVDAFLRALINNMNNTNPNASPFTSALGLSVDPVSSDFNNNNNNNNNNTAFLPDVLPNPPNPPFQLVPHAVPFSNNNNNTQNNNNNNVDKTNLFVCNLNPAMQDDDLYSLFSIFGEVESCKILLNIVTGKSRCIGFVKYRSEADAARALEGFHLYYYQNLIQNNNNQNQINNKSAVFYSPCIALRYANQTAEYVPLNSENYNNNKVFIRNVPNTLTKTELERFFSQFGAIQEVVIHADHSRVGTEHSFNDTCNSNTSNSLNNTLNNNNNSNSTNHNNNNANIIFITFQESQSAFRCVKEIHLKKPFKESVFPLLAKIAESAERRSARLQKKRQKQNNNNKVHNTNNHNHQHHNNNNDISLSNTYPLPVSAAMTPYSNYNNNNNNNYQKPDLRSVNPYNNNNNNNNNNFSWTVNSATFPQNNFNNTTNNNNNNNNNNFNVSFTTSTDAASPFTNTLNSTVYSVNHANTMNYTNNNNTFGEQTFTTLLQSLNNNNNTLNSSQNNSPNTVFINGQLFSF